MSKKNVVRVTIVGEEYTVRSDASPERTRAVAKHVDQTIRAVMNSGAIIESHKAAILAALQITDELFSSRESHQELGDEMQALSADVRRMLPPSKRPT
jgi:cell division protein ZapA